MFIHETLARARRLFPRKEAVIDGPTRLTYAAFGERVERLAGALAGLGVRSGERVAALMANSHRYMEVYFAAERAGAVLVPLNTRLAAAEVAPIIDDAEVRLLVVDEAYLPVCRALAGTVPSLRHVIVAPNASAAGTPVDADADAPEVALAGRLVVEYEAALRAADPMAAVARGWRDDDVVQLYYTSGTTGRPKGVMLTQVNVMANARHSVMLFGLDDRDVYIHAAPLFHLADAWSCWTLAWLGATHVFLREFAPAAYLDLIERERVTVTCIVPTIVHALLDAPALAETDRGSLRLLIFGASPMPVERLRAAMTAFPGATFWHMYGMTETAPFATANRYDAASLDGPPAVVRRLASCGREIAGVEVRVVDEDDRPVASGEIGEIAMRGPNVMGGYWRQPEASATALRGGWMRSGDLATVDEEGYIFIVDRAKDMIISGGENVYSVEVENALYGHPAVLEAAVIGVPDERWGEHVHAVVVLRPGAAATEAELSAFCRGGIAGYKIPRSYEFIEALPKTGSGKVQKGLLRERHWQGQSRRVH